jgi:hypothetical protein
MQTEDNIIISITQADIDGGVSEAGSCPVALAMKRDGWDGVAVCSEFVTAEGKTWYGKGLYDFVTRFDRNRGIIHNGPAGDNMPEPTTLLLSTDIEDVGPHWWDKSRVNGWIGHQLS